MGETNLSNNIARNISENKNINILCNNIQHYVTSNIRQKHELWINSKPVRIYSSDSWCSDGCELIENVCTKSIQLDDIFVNKKHNIDPNWGNSSTNNKNTMRHKAPMEWNNQTNPMKKKWFNNFHLASRYMP